MCYLEINSVIEELEKNEQRILEVCDRIASIPKKDFMDWFPSSYGMQIVHEDSLAATTTAGRLSARWSFGSGGSGGLTCVWTRAKISGM